MVILNVESFKQLQQTQQTLKALRLGLIGDDDEKQHLLESNELDELLKLTNQLINVDPENEDLLPILDHLLVIIHSLTFYQPALTILIDHYNFVEILTLLILNYQNNDDIVIQILKILTNTIASTKNLYNSVDILNSTRLQSNDEFNFKQLLLHKINNPNNETLLLQMFKLIPLLNPVDLQILVLPLIKILKNLIGPYQQELLSSNENYTTCLETSIIPTPLTETFSNLLPPLLFSIGSLLNFDQVFGVRFRTSNEELVGIPVKVDLVISQDVYFTITSFLKSSNLELKLSSVFLLINFSTNSNLSTSEQNQNVLKLLPYLLQLIKFDYKKKSFKVYKSSLNLSRKLNPLYALSKLSLNYEFVNDFLLNCHVLKNFIEVLKKFTKNVQLVESNYTTSYISTLQDYSDLFLILSSITAHNELNRVTVLEDELLESCEITLEFHYNTLLKLINSSQEDISLLSSTNRNEVESLTVTNYLCITICYLLRSLSRSVALLRTKLGETKVVDIFIGILKITETEMSEKLQSISPEFINDFILLKTVILSIISNLVLDFSPLRTKLLNNELILIISKMLSETKYDSIKINCLWTVRHVIYRETSIIIDQVTNQIGIFEIFKYCSPDEDLNIQEHAFNILRNLSCSKTKNYMINKILTNFDKFYNEELDTSISFFNGLKFDDKVAVKFFQFLNWRLSNLNALDSKHDSVIEAIVFIIVHIAVINEKYRDFIIENTSLLERVKEILINSKSNDVKMACIWLVINLTWFENIGHFSSLDTVSTRDRERADVSTQTRSGSSSSYPITITNENDLRVTEEEISSVVNDDENDAEPSQGGSSTSIRDRLRQHIRTRPNASQSRRGEGDNDNSLEEGIGNSNSNSDSEIADVNMVDEPPAVIIPSDIEEESPNEHAHDRVEKLNSIGLRTVLKDLIETSDNIDLKERIRTALFHLNQFP